MLQEIEKPKFLPNPDGLWDGETKSFIIREQCVQECMGCNKMYSDHDIGDVCIAYISPKAIQYRMGKMNACGLQSNRELSVEESGKKINPLKLAKRSRR